MKKIVFRLKNSVQDVKSNFKEKFKEAKEKPKSKRRSFLVGFTTVAGIFGLTLLGPSLAAVAQDVPQVPAPTNCAAGAPSITHAVAPPKEIIHNGLAGAAATAFGVVATPGAFVIGAGCGVVICYGILHLQGKPLFKK